MLQSHSGANLAEAFMTILHDFEISDKVTAIAKVVADKCSPGSAV
jgi:hypothetical protein